MILFLCGCLIYFLLPYSAGITLNKEGSLTSYTIFIQSWQNVVSIEWIRKNGRQIVQFRLAKMTIQKRIGQSAKSRKKQIDKQSNTQKKIMKKWKRLYCIIVNLFLDFPRMLFRFLAVFHLEILEIKGNFGTQNPASTGMAYGVIQSLNLFCRNRVHLSVRPDFLEKKHEGSIVLIFHFIFFRLLWWLIQSGVRILLSSVRCRFKMKGNLAW